MEWFLILAIVLLCPLMHFWLMRKGNHEHGGKPHEEKIKKNKGKCCH